MLLGLDVFTQAQQRRRNDRPVEAFCVWKRLSVNCPELIVDNRFKRLPGGPISDTTDELAHSERNIGFEDRNKTLPEFTRSALFVKVYCPRRHSRVLLNHPETRVLITAEISKLTRALIGFVGCLLLCCVEVLIVCEGTCKHLYAEWLADEVAVPLVFKIDVAANLVELSAGVPSVREKCRPLLNSVLPRVRSCSTSQLAI
ncbi:hypothetical protein [Halorubrum ezzemoulense]|uniref:hypothetical protein n=1 Tax=Halorubrum ezzemoulense TaxID=337243 RepID=UPI00232ABDD4|nr:hypothetical protein [Halorubrum ezzemoulense]MDB2239449.1 hypothetical protein [Halorubrum ezzemoulense]MDB2250063.1 hypothetical protein [Halorubrum ezzemoulense]